MPETLEVARLAKIIHDVIENDDDSDGGAYARAARQILASLQPSVSEMSDELVERVARAICGMTGCQAGTPSVQCSSRRSCQGDLRDVLSEYGDAARAAIAALSPEGEP